MLPPLFALSSLLVTVSLGFDPPSNKVERGRIVHRFLQAELAKSDDPPAGPELRIRIDVLADQVWPDHVAIVSFGLLKKSLCLTLGEHEAISTRDDAEELASFVRNEISGGR